MKSISICFALALLLITFRSSNAQMVGQVISIGPGYANQSFYSMAGGEVSNVSNTDWDLAFQFRGFTGSILINSKNNVKLWKANKASGDWNTMTASDTTGILNASFELVNADTSWNFGAFNRTNNSSNPFDLGWGVYDFMTHVVTGDSIYFIRLPDASLRKLRIDNLDGLSFVYTFRYANLDGSNEVVTTMDKANFANRHFGYYSLLSGTSVNREPAISDWDITFCQYLNTQPFTYKVAGILSNDSVMAVKAYPVDTATAAYSGLTFRREINTIGFDWKTFTPTPPPGSWAIEDSIVYFVKDRQGDIWKMIFTGFGGSANGQYIFYKGPAVSTGLSDAPELKTFGVFPNPATDFARMVVDVKQAGPSLIRLMDLNGRIVKAISRELTNGLQLIDLDLSDIPAGLYQITLIQGNETRVGRIVIQ